EAIERDLKVMDSTAFALARENRMPIIVFSIREPGAVAAVLGGKGRATIVGGGRAAGHWFVARRRPTGKCPVAERPSWQPQRIILPSASAACRAPSRGSKKDLEGVA